MTSVLVSNNTCRRGHGNSDASTIHAIPSNDPAIKFVWSWRFFRDLLVVGLHPGYVDIAGLKWVSCKRKFCLRLTQIRFLSVCKCKNLIFSSQIWGTFICGPTSDGCATCCVVQKQRVNQNLSGWNHLRGEITTTMQIVSCACEQLQQCLPSHRVKYHTKS